MRKKTTFDVKLRNADTGEVHTRKVVADNKEYAGAAAIRKARNSCETMADRTYASFEIISCEARSR